MMFFVSACILVRCLACSVAAAGAMQFSMHIVQGVADRMFVLDVLRGWPNMKLHTAAACNKCTCKCVCTLLCLSIIMHALI